MRVLIVEDQVLLRDGLTRMLTEYGMELTTTRADGTQLAERLVASGLLRSAEAFEDLTEHPSVITLDAVNRVADLAQLLLDLGNVEPEVSLALAEIPDGVGQVLGRASEPVETVPDAVDVRFQVGDPLLVGNVMQPRYLSCRQSSVWLMLHRRLARDYETSPRRSRRLPQARRSVTSTGCRR